MIATKCNNCHGSTTAQFFGGLDLSGDFVPRVLDKPATYNNVSAASKPNCVADAKIIDSAAPENSVMLKKINKTQACGDVMPQVGTLEAAELTCMQTWLMTF